MQEQPDIILGVDGMSCPFCVFGIEKMKQLDQIENLTVKLEKGFVDIYLKQGKSLSEKRAACRRKKIGFSVRAIEYVNKEAKQKMSYLSVSLIPIGSFPWR